LPTTARHKDEPAPTRRSIQDANYHNQIVKEQIGASFTSLSSTLCSPLESRRHTKCAYYNKQGPNSFCFSTHFVACLQSNPASGYSGLRFFTARLTSNPSRMPPRANPATRKLYYHSRAFRSTGQFFSECFLNGLPTAVLIISVGNVPSSPNKKLRIGAADGS